MLCGCAKIRLPDQSGTFLSHKRAAFDYANPTNLTYFENVYEAAGTNSLVQRLTRDRIVYDLLGTIDYSFEGYAYNISSKRQVKDFFVDATTLGLAAAGTVVPGASAKATLAAISAGVLGMNVSVDKNFFNTLATEAILCEARALRMEQRAKILRLIRSKDVKEYSLQEVELDIIEYYYCGTIQRALQSLHEKSTSRLKEAMTAENKARGLTENN